MKHIKKLPTIFQTVSNKTFFDATVDQMFNKKSNYKREAGYIGSKNGAYYKPKEEYYLTAPTKPRIDYQLEPVVATHNSSTAVDTDHIFYEDFLNHYRKMGSITENINKFLSSDYYTFAPPIDVDKFLNYASYRWMPNGIPTITVDTLQPIGSVDDWINNNLIGNTGKISDLPVLLGDNGYEFTITNGLMVKFKDAEFYTSTYYIEGAGKNLILVPAVSADYYDNSYDFELNTGSVWDATKYAPTQDYMTIERGSVDFNDWSRSNRWVHEDTIRTACSVTDIFISNLQSAAAHRPILEFSRNIELYGYGRRFGGFADHAISGGFSTVNGQPMAGLKYTYGSVTGPVDVPLAAGDVLMFINSGNVTPVNTTDGTVTNITDTLWVITNVAGIARLEPVSFNVFKNDYVLKNDPLYKKYQFDSNTFVFSGEFEQRNFVYDDNFNNIAIPVEFSKFKKNQPPKFDLYDYRGIPIGDTLFFPDTNFQGNTIFGYKENTLSPVIDAFLDMRVTYEGYNKTSDIVFEHTLETSVYSNGDVEIPGYKFFKVSKPENNFTFSDYFNDFTMSHTWVPAGTDKIYFLDRFSVVEEDLVNNTFYIGVNPKDEDVFININGHYYTGEYILENDTSYGAYKVVFPSNTLNIGDNLEIYTYSFEAPLPGARGHFEVPLNYKNNSESNELLETTFANYAPQFRSVIENQTDINYTYSNFRDTAKDNTIGRFITQPKDSIFPAAFFSMTSDLDAVQAVRFSSKEYSRFKNKFIQFADNLLLNGVIDSFTDIDDDIAAIMQIVNNGNSTAIAFEDAHMFTYGKTDSDFDQDIILPVESAAPPPAFMALASFETFSTTSVTLPNITINQLTDTIYVIFNNNTLTENVDYTRTVDATGAVTFSNFTVTGDCTFRIYRNTKPIVVPATPVRLGIFGPTIPKMIMDDTYAEPAGMIIGHDGSKTRMVNTKRDLLWFEVEKRIYNGLHSKFKEDYVGYFNIENLRPGKFRTDDFRYTVAEYEKVRRPIIMRWLTQNSVSYQENVGPTDNWKTWNFRDTMGGMPANWRGLYLYLYDTVRPDLYPWQCVGYSEKPSYWDSQYGTDYSSNNVAMWEDIRYGVNQETNFFGYSNTYFRGVDFVVPVDASGQLLSPMDLGYLEPSESIDDSWYLGDYGAGEYAWFCSENYHYDMFELMVLLKPAVMLTRNWDTLSLSSAPPVGKDVGVQLISTVSYKRTNFNTSVYNSAETPLVLGYQMWVVDKLKSILKNVDEEYTEKVDNASAKLGYRFSGFTNSETLTVKLEGISASSSSLNSIIPPSDYDVFLHRGESVREATCSGVIVRLTEEQKYEVYGYDNNKHSFEVFEKINNSRELSVTVNGTPMEVAEYQANYFYNIGDYVRFNDRYYLCKFAHSSTSFDYSKWQRLVSAPVVGGMSITLYKDLSNVVATIPYGHQFDTAEEVYNFLYSYGQKLVADGWIYDQIGDNGEVFDWMQSANEFLYWADSNWEVNSAIRLQPNASSLKFSSAFGYAADIYEATNGSANILDQNGVLISPELLSVVREDGTTTYTSNNEEVGIYLVRVQLRTIEHAIVFENETSFGDIVYAPIYGIRQPRLQIEGFFTENWYGKYEANGYLVNDDKLIPNIENVTHSITLYHNTEKDIDNTGFESAARHVIGYESKQYLENLDMSNDTQFQFYQGMIRQKGTVQSITKLLRNSEVASDQDLKVYEEWAFKLADFGNTQNKRGFDIFISENVATQIIQRIRLNFEMDGIITVDNNRDSVIDIDFDDNTQVLQKPIVEQSGLIFKNYDLPMLIDSGPVLPEDVTLTCFDAENLLTKNETFTATDLVWFASDYTNNWNVYSQKMTTTVTVSGETGVQTSNFVWVYDETNDIDASTRDDYRGIIYVNGKPFEYYRTLDGSIPTNNFIFLKNANGFIEPGDYETLIPVGSVVTILKTLKFASQAAVPVGLNNTMYWISNNTWQVRQVLNSVHTTLREKRPVVNNKLLDNVIVYNKDTGATKTQLQVVDILQGIFPSEITRNLNFNCYSDPASYNSSFWTDEKVGFTWWDKSTSKIMNYYQGTPEQNRKYFNRFHPDSSIDVYEWVRSDVPPDSYAGEGTVYSTDKFVTQTYFDASLGISRTAYYFWVKGLTVTPKLKDRTMPVVLIDRMLRNLTDYGVQWCAALESNTENFEFVVTNILPLMQFGDNSLHMNYRNEDIVAVGHTEWTIIGEGNPASDITDRLWNKMVDSICGYDKLGQVVPDPRLNEFSKYGISIRPRQTMFKNAQAARQVLVTTLQNLSFEDSKTGVEKIYWDKSYTFEDYETLTLEQAQYLRDYLNELKNVTFPYYNKHVNVNLVYFALFNYLLTEQQHIDWAFKTSYIYVEQERAELQQTPSLQRETFSSVFSYMNEVKPYHTKIRSFNANIAINEDVSVEVDYTVNIKINVQFKPHCIMWDSTKYDVLPYDGCGPDERIDAGMLAQSSWDLYPWDLFSYDGNIGSVLTAPTFDMNQLTNVNTYTGDGVTKLFEVTFDQHETFDMFAVTIDNMYTEMYYMYGNGIAFFEAPPLGSEIKIYQVHPIDSGSFLDNFTQDHVKIGMYESLMIHVDTINPAAPTTVYSFTMFDDNFGRIKYYRNSTDFSGLLTSDFLIGDDEILVSNVTSLLADDLVLVTPTNPMEIRVDSEVIFVHQTEDLGSGNFRLFNLVRGVKGTPIQNHLTGKRAFVLSEAELPEYEESVYWNVVNSGNILNTGNENASYLIYRPGSAVGK